MKKDDQDDEDDEDERERRGNESERDEGERRLVPCAIPLIALSQPVYRYLSYLLTIRSHHIHNSTLTGLSSPSLILSLSLCLSLSRILSHSAHLNSRVSS